MESLYLTQEDNDTLKAIIADREYYIRYFAKITNSSYINLKFSKVSQVLLGRWELLQQRMDPNRGNPDLDQLVSHIYHIANTTRIVKVNNEKGNCSIL